MKDMVNLINWMVNMHPLRTIGTLTLGILVLVILLVAVIMNRERNRRSKHAHETVYSN